MENIKEKIKAKIYEANPELKELSFGCAIRNIFWYKSESDRKNGKIDWFATGHHDEGREGIVVKDLRSDFLPMWVDCGDQLEFKINPTDIVSFEIIGHPIHLEHLFNAIDMKPDSEEYGENLNSNIIQIVRGSFGVKGYDMSMSFNKNLDSNIALVELIAGMLNIIT